jgi:hypothetical protein
MATGVTDRVAAERLVERAGAFPAPSGLKAVLPVCAAAVAHPATLFVFERVVVRPVQEPAEIVPLVHAAHLDAITHAERHAFCKINVVDDQQGFAIADIDDKPLVLRVFVVIG